MLMMIMIYGNDIFMIALKKKEVIFIKTGSMYERDRGMF